MKHSTNSGIVRSVIQVRFQVHTLVVVFFEKMEYAYYFLTFQSLVCMKFLSEHIRLPGFGSWDLGPGSCNPGPGSWDLGPGSWVLGPIKQGT